VSRERKIDIAVALVGLATSVAVMYLHGFGTPDPDVRDGDLLGVALLAGINLPLVERRRYPFAVFAASVAATVGIHALGYPGELGLWPALAVYSLAAHAHDERAARIGGLAAGASIAILGAIAVVVDPDPGIAFGAVAWAGAWVIGDVTRQRRAASPSWPTGRSGPSARRPGNAGSPRRRSARGSRASCTTRRATRST
jgi:hypothetical protein